MDAQRKYAYRFLVYWGLVVIRGIEWTAHRPLKLLNPIALRREVQLIRTAGAVANWLHNAALFSALDFEGFDEERFWADYDRMVERYGDPWHLSSFFDLALEEARGGSTPSASPTPGHRHGIAES